MDEFNLSPDKLASMSTEEKQALLVKMNEQYKSEYGESLLPEENQSLLGKAVRGAAKGLDYARGAIAAGVTAPIAEAISGKEITAPGTLAKVLKGEALAPSSADILEKLGVEAGPALSEALPGLYNETGEGLKLQKGGWADPTARGAAGFALDVATDPTTYFAPGVSRLAKGTAQASKDAAERLAYEVTKGSEEGLLKELANKLTAAKAKNVGAQALNLAVNPFDVATRSTGRAVYSGPFVAADVSAKMRGAKPLSSVGWEGNIFGTRGQMENQFSKKAEEAISSRNQLFEAMGTSPSAINYDTAFSEAQKIAARQRKAGNADAANAIEAMIEGPKEAGRLLRKTGDPDWAAIASQQKTDLAEKLPESAFQGVGMGTAKGPINQARKSMAGGLKTELEKAAAKTVPGGDKVLRESNDLLRTLLSSKKARDTVARVEGRRPAITQLEKYGTIGMGVGSDNPIKGVSFLAAKKVLDLLGGPAAGSGIGIGLKKLSETPLYNEAMKRYFIQDQQARQSPWSVMGGSNE